MSDLETRLRQELDSPVVAGDTAMWLRSVRRRVALRRGVRTGSVVVGVVAVLVGSTVLLQGLHGQGTPPEPVKSPSATASVPAGAERPGVVGLSVAGNRVYRLTYDVGCRECDSVWLRQPSGGWERLYDFKGLAAYGGTRLGMTQFGPIDSFTMAPDGTDGWAWGQRFWSTHDGGRTWTAIAGGPGQRTLYGRKVVAGSRYAWAARTTFQGGTLWRSRVGSDSWRQVAGAPGTDELWGIIGVLPDGGVAIGAYRSDGTHRLLVRGQPGSWSSTPVPFSSQASILESDGGFWLQTGGSDPQIYRLRGSLFVHLRSAPGKYIVPLDAHRTLVDHDPVLVLDDTGATHATDLPSGTEPGAVQRTDDGTFWLIANEGKVFSSTDGLHWTGQE